MNSYFFCWFPNFGVLLGWSKNFFRKLNFSKNIMAFTIFVNNRWLVNGANMNAKDFYVKIVMATTFLQTFSLREETLDIPQSFDALENLKFKFLDFYFNQFQVSKTTYFPVITQIILWIFDLKTDHIFLILKYVSWRFTFKNIAIHRSTVSDSPTSSRTVLPAKLIDGRCRIQSPVTLVHLIFRKFQWFSPKLA